MGQRLGGFQCRPPEKSVPILAVTVEQDRCSPGFDPTRPEGNLAGRLEHMKHVDIQSTSRAANENSGPEWWHSGIRDFWGGPSASADFQQ